MGRRSTGAEESNTESGSNTEEESTSTTSSSDSDVPRRKRKRRTASSSSSNNEDSNTNSDSDSDSDSDSENRRRRRKKKRRKKREDRESAHKKKHKRKKKRATKHKKKKRSEIEKLQTEIINHKPESKDSKAYKIKSICLEKRPQIEEQVERVDIYKSKEEYIKKNSTIKEFRSNKSAENNLRYSKTIPSKEKLPEQDSYSFNNSKESRYLIQKKSTDQSVQTKLYERRQGYDYDRMNFQKVERHDRNYNRNERIPDVPEKRRVPEKRFEQWDENEHEKSDYKIYNRKNEEKTDDFIKYNTRPFNKPEKEHIKRFNEDYKSEQEYSKDYGRKYEQTRYSGDDYNRYKQNTTRQFDQEIEVRHNKNIESKREMEPREHRFNQNSSYKRKQDDDFYQRRPQPSHHDNYPKDKFVSNRRQEDNHQRGNNRLYQSYQNESRSSPPREFDNKDNFHTGMIQKFGRRPEERFNDDRDQPKRRHSPIGIPERDVRVHKSTDRDREGLNMRDRKPLKTDFPREQNERRTIHKNRWGDQNETYEWGKKEKIGENLVPEKTEKEKPNFGLSGKLAEDTNLVNGVVIKYSEPTEGRKPKRRWRFYPFKGETSLPILYLHRSSFFLIGRDRTVTDIPLDHPSISKQHAVFQYRLVPFTRDDGSMGKRVRPYIIDLGSSNGTYVNNNKIEPQKYVELLERDVVKFGYSQREYVLLHENSKDEDNDDDDVQTTIKEEEDDVKVKHEID